ncbi:hypothetical protein [Luteimonas wenzhouensis]|uniref:Sulfotransferase family protein n=1 Tax=Luteimonas wenzhouensis TaxID=2599615 RepID=A0A5C5TW36_9GAMM|nr:hypothetical protein [Luteimonas wenzhouensis]TWT17608.1 hypothetical protein FQY79_12155 [Luteimonas wenzhouensis]
MTESKPQVGTRTAVIVLGMHRSGTSAIAGVLSLLGIATPRHLMAPTRDNPKGYWESTALMTVHDRILQSAGSSWDDWDRFNPAWIDSPAAPQLLAQLEEAIVAEFNGAPTLLVKDPRMCRLMPAWRVVLERMGIDARVVMPLRKPLEVSLSLQARNGFGALQGQALWLRHVLEAEAGSRGLVRSVATYDALLHDWRGVVDRLGRELGLAWPRWSGAVEAEVDAYLTEELHRNRSDDGELRPTGRPQDEWVREAYALLAGEPGPDAPEVRARLDALRKAFDEACHAYMPVVHEIEGRLQADRNDLKAQLADARRELEASTARIDELVREAGAREEARQAELRKREADSLAQRAAEAEAQAQRLAEVAQALQLAEERAQRLAKEQAQRVAEAAQAQQLAEERAQRLAKAEQALQQSEERARQLADEQARAGQAETALEAERVRAEDLEARLREAGEAADDAERRHAGEIDALRAARKAEVEALQAQLEEANASIRVRFGETRTLTEMVFALEAKVAALTRRGRELEERLAAARHAAELESGALRGAIEAQRATIERLNHWGNALLAGRTLKAARILSGAPREMQVPSLAKLDDVPDEQLLRKSRLFDEAWYLLRYGDVARRNVDPVKHYLRHGAAEGRDPGPAFSTRGYLERYPDVAASGINPLVHYLRHGMQEGRVATGTAGGVKK